MKTSSGQLCCSLYVPALIAVWLCVPVGCGAQLDASGGCGACQAEEGERAGGRQSERRRESASCLHALRKLTTGCLWVRPWLLRWMLSASNMLRRWLLPLLRLRQLLRRLRLRKLMLRTMQLLCLLAQPSSQPQTSSQSRLLLLQLLQLLLPRLPRPAQLSAQPLHWMLRRLGRNSRYHRHRHRLLPCHLHLHLQAQLGPSCLLKQSCLLQTCSQAAASLPE